MQAQLTRMMGVLWLAVWATAGCSPPPDETADPGDDVEPIQQAIDNSCLQVGVTTFDGRYVRGYGSISNKGCSGANISIVRNRWYGPEYLTTKTIGGTGFDVHLTYDCAHTGVHDFYTRLWYYNFNNEFVHKDSNVLRNVNCP